MTESVPGDLLRASARQRGIVVLAGAEVSAAAPSSVPGRRRLNEMIVGALCDRLDGDPGRPEGAPSGSLLRGLIESRRQAEHEQAPSDYQAQILEEACGARYFQALQCLRVVSAPNAVHRRIAWLAKHGVVRAVVTTGLDLLFERALKEQGVPYVAVHDQADHSPARIGGGSGIVPVVKLRGCASDQLSLTDTLKRQLLGRNAHVRRWLECLLRAHHWVPVGCSADELLEVCSGETEPVIAQPERFLAALGEALDLPPLEEGPAAAAGARLGGELVHDELASWAGALGPIAAVNCLASLLAAQGEAAAAFHLLHAYWDDPRDQEGRDRGHFRLNHGRLGMGHGLLDLVDEGWSTVQGEAFQTLWRRGYLGNDARGLAWGGLALLWRGETSRACSLLKEAAGRLDSPTDLTDEEKADVVFAQGEAFYVLGQPEPYVAGWARYAALAGRSGDLPRQASLAALATLFHAEFAGESFPAVVDGEWKEILIRAERLCDPTIQGFIRLADGRHAVRNRDGETALLMLELASQSFSEAARPRWRALTAIERVKALLDLGRPDEAEAALAESEATVARHPIWLPWFHEASGHLHLGRRRKSAARDAFGRAVECAATLGLERRAKALRSYLLLIRA